MKREMWGTLRTVAVDKAIVITLHSMEEASARAKKVGILAKKMLGESAWWPSTRRLRSCLLQLWAQTMHWPNGMPPTRCSSVARRRPRTGAHATNSRSAHGRRRRNAHRSAARDRHVPCATLRITPIARGLRAEFTVERAGLESVFLKVIRENDVLNEDRSTPRQRWRRTC
ncbi:uncharacterized protein C8Q71DRAFT_407612 [Rhodofomes roseus]|uniref:Uncharacterized protein n=1 Tax=Rhodofomes roseus TaxID=34475 RepID=A0ABQ8JYY5_9APHY|nr:uncharacterized protein C8Q71DRAFT_407612 [Rhodofomes roseus]KAH9829505.1 hypothetical protein C8Q71DRAFT_407612 [Rhodofomes roseus]